MSNFIVLVKQVPDVSRITDNVFHPETGTLMRNKLPSVINELDAQAFAFALRMREASGSGRVVCLTMGPPNADEVLRYGLARGADAGVLLTDRLLGGADTWATANPLAFAIRKIVQDHFQGLGDYYVVAGMQSVDGDTAQVPAQVAEELGLPCVAYATAVEYLSGRFRFTRIISGGSQVVSPRRLPCVVTVAKYEHTRHAGFTAARRARRAGLTIWGAADIKPTGCGAAGSKTRVVKVFPPGKTSRKCLHLADIASFVRALSESMKAAVPGAAQAAAQQRYVLPAHRPTLWERPFEVTEKEAGEWQALNAKIAELGLPGPEDCAETERARLAEALKGRFDRRGVDAMTGAAAQPAPFYRGDVWVVAEHAQGEPIA
ncbi:MAG: electron transfer flavoprotein subunit beta/FixA family protein, partial [Elusimicrobiota bacterium]